MLFLHGGDVASIMASRRVYSRVFTKSWPALIYICMVNREHMGRTMLLTTSTWYIAEGGRFE